MTYSRDWRSYPPSFIPLIERAAVTEVRIPCADYKDAKRLEGKLHAFFGVLHRSALKDPTILDLDNLSRKVRVKAEDRWLVAMPRDMEPDNALILTALEQAPSPLSSDIPMSAELREMFDKGLTKP